MRSRIQPLRSFPRPRAVPNPPLAGISGGMTADGRHVIGIQDLVHIIRAAGAKQPILAMSWKDDHLFEGARGIDEAPLIDDANIVYEASPRLAGTRTDAQRDAHFGFMAKRAPVLAN